jgi:hypothetical protein
MKKDFQPKQMPSSEPQPIVLPTATDSAKPNVICSQSKSVYRKPQGLIKVKNNPSIVALEDAISQLSVKANSLCFDDWVHFVVECVKNVKSFYEHFDKKYKSKSFSIVVKIDNGFYFDNSQLRDLYKLMSLSVKPVIDFSSLNLIVDKCLSELTSAIKNYKIDGYNKKTSFSWENDKIVCHMIDEFALTASFENIRKE